MTPTEARLSFQKKLFYSFAPLLSYVMYLTRSALLQALVPSIDLHIGYPPTTNRCTHIGRTQNLQNQVHCNQQPVNKKTYHI
jgi:hypothetical protein